MAEAQSSQITDHNRPEKAITDLDFAAAQQLMQLSEEDNNNKSSSSSNNNNNNHKKIKQDDGDEVDQSRPGIGVITWAKMEEIFGKEEDVDRPKKRRYRSLAHIYLTTKPIMNGRSSYGKKVRTF